MTTAGTLYEETVVRGHAELISTSVLNNVASVWFALPVEFNTYLFEIQSVKATMADAALCARVSQDNGSTVNTTYFNAMVGLFANYASNPAYYNNGSTGVHWPSTIAVSHGIAAGNGISGTLTMFNGKETNTLRHVISNVSAWHTTLYHQNNRGAAVVGGVAGNPRCTHLLFFFNGGNMSKGVIRQYGMRHL